MDNKTIESWFENYHNRFKTGIKAHGFDSEFMREHNVICACLNYQELPAFFDKWEAMKPTRVNTTIIAHKPTPMDVAFHRMMNPGCTQGIEPMFQPYYTRRERKEFNPPKYSSRALLTIEELMKKQTQSDVALNIMSRASQSDVAMRIAMNSVYGVFNKPLDEMNNEELEELQRKDHESNMLFTGKKAYVKEIVFDEKGTTPAERSNIKGAYMGVCNLSSCKSGQPASWYNYGSLNYYCPGCAKRLSNDPVNKRDAFNSFGHDLCLEGPEITKD